ncbi:hypothetical protein WJX81_002512 [Elliptochloris bilobata]|uniref:Uncharacterized protein n=1 Tax=Elliptochloris bilobata TaxID=381761 RepID=A0AAW1QU99_9CHLO
MSSGAHVAVRADISARPLQLWTTWGTRLDMYSRDAPRVQRPSAAHRQPHAESVLPAVGPYGPVPIYGRSVESILAAVAAERHGAREGQDCDILTLGDPGEASDEDALDVAFNQLPRWSLRGDSHAFDWSGATNYTALHLQEPRLCWDVSRARGGTERVRVAVDGAEVDVLPLWVAVHQDHATGLARLYESIHPLEDDLVAALDTPLTPLCAVAGLAFERNADAVSGAWRNYFIGLLGDVAAAEEDVLWPNQVLHGERSLHNARGGWDLARFLADADKDDVDAHLANLRRLQEERRYRNGWCYHMLCSRWGREAIRELGIAVF